MGEGRISRGGSSGDAFEAKFEVDPPPPPETNKFNKDEAFVFVDIFEVPKVFELSSLFFFFLEFVLLLAFGFCEEDSSASFLLVLNDQER